jgi:hypothetical protein
VTYGDACSARPSFPEPPWENELISVQIVAKPLAFPGISRSRETISLGVAAATLLLIEGKAMANESKKCAHLPCLCMAPSGEKYCSQFCKEAGSAETEIACDCGHPACSK